MKMLLSNPYLSGVIFGGATIGVVSLWPSKPALGLLATILGLALGVYIGSFSYDQRFNKGFQEIVVAVFLMVFIILGFWISPLYLAAAWLLHPLWDWMHHFKKVHTRINRWIPPFCGVYDVIVAVYIVVRWF